MASTVRKVGVAGVALGLSLGIAGTIPASASFDGPAPAPATGGLLGGGGGLLGLLDGTGLLGLVGGLLSGEGGLVGHEGGVLAGDDTLGEVVSGFAGEADVVEEGPAEVVGAVSDVLAMPKIGGEGSFGDPKVGGGLLGLGGLLGGLLGGAGGLLGGAF